MKKIIILIVSAIVAVNMIATVHVSAEEKEVNDLAHIVGKAIAIQNGEWDSSLGPYDINGKTEYRYILSHDGNRDEVNFKLVPVGGLDQLAKDLASVL